MILQQLELNGVTYDFSKVTLVVGLNGAGKSWLLSKIDLLIKWILDDTVHGFYARTDESYRMVATFDNGLVYSLNINRGIVTNEELKLDNDPLMYLTAKMYHERKDNKYHAVLRGKPIASCENGLTYLAKWANECQLVDDFADHADYRNAAIRAKEVMQSAYQVIITTHNQFVMDVIPLESWLILVRGDGFGKVYGYPELAWAISKFQFTGLGNFDFFTSNYFLRREAEFANPLA